MEIQPFDILLVGHWRPGGTKESGTDPAVRPVRALLALLVSNQRLFDGSELVGVGAAAVPAGEKVMEVPYLPFAQR
ncbi:hypothetical protein BRC65_01230 [Halobacteriales archaeon QH_2_65_14]|nr:MAG: hypothetical protein BRC65_01230 [Halobacteriales archaeon QH_2_65_14]